LRDEGEEIERIGIARAQDRIEIADLLLWLGDETPPDHAACLWLYPRSDVRETHDAIESRIAVSARTGAGVQEVVAWLIAQSRTLLPATDRILLSRRHRTELEIVRHSMLTVQQVEDGVLQAEALRQARLAIDRLTGRADFDALLDSVFGQFCLGK
jgi:tRNA modification GTPase